MRPQAKPGACQHTNGRAEYCWRMPIGSREGWADNMNKTHTPGPWRLAGGAGDGYALIGADNTVIAAKGFASTVDARIIALAPAMLDLLREAAEVLDNYADAEGPDSEGHSACNAAMSVWGDIQRLLERIQG
jgi:hypothetical protein